MTDVTILTRTALSAFLRWYRFAFVSPIAESPVEIFQILHLRELGEVKERFR